MATTKECTECPKGINCFNGRYCPETRQMVEYAPTPLCGKVKNNEKISRQ